MSRRAEFALAVTCVAVIVGAIHMLAPRSAAPSHETVAPPPPITKHMRQVLAETKGFSALISYTDAGFEPQTLEIQKGQSVRFTNNSSKDVWVSAVAENGIIYPAEHDSCGQSAFDSCVQLPPHDIWEFTFTTAGTWHYRNAAFPSDEGTIVVN